MNALVLLLILVLKLKIALFLMADVVRKIDGCFCKKPLQTSQSSLNQILAVEVKDVLVLL